MPFKKARFPSPAPLIVGSLTLDCECLRGLWPHIFHLVQPEIKGDFTDEKSLSETGFKREKIPKGC